MLEFLTKSAVVLLYVFNCIDYVVIDSNLRNIEKEREFWSISRIGTEYIAKCLNVTGRLEIFFHGNQMGLQLYLKNQSKKPFHIQCLVLFQHNGPPSFLQLDLELEDKASLVYCI
jgi:hypothetical protein